MPLSFYPHDEDIGMSSINDRLEILMNAAERYKAIIMDAKSVYADGDAEKKVTPKDLKVAFNWQELAKVLREIREQPEGNVSSRALKADQLTKLAEIYEVLRAAKMPKLEAVRMALMNEANQLRAGGGG
jgi:hypothetical protein